MTGTWDEKCSLCVTDWLRCEEVVDAIVENNVFLDSAVSSKSALEPSKTVLDGDVRSVPVDRSAVAVSRTGLGKSDVEIKRETSDMDPKVMSLDEDFVEMINEAYNEILLFPSSQEVENCSDLDVTQRLVIKEETKEQYSEASVDDDASITPPLAESSPKKIGMNQERGTAGFASRKKLLTNHDNKTFHQQQHKHSQQPKSRSSSSSSLLPPSCLENGYYVNFINVPIKEKPNIKSKSSLSVPASKKMTEIRRPPPDPLRQNSKMVSVLKKNFEEDPTTLGSYFANFSPDETTIRTLSRLPGAGSRVESSDVLADYRIIQGRMRRKRQKSTTSYISPYIGPRVSSYHQLVNLEKKKVFERQRRMKLADYKYGFNWKTLFSKATYSNNSNSF